MSIKAVFFDLDGTLLDTAMDLGGALNTLLTDHSKPEIPLSELRNIVSDGAAALLKVGFDVTETDRTYPQLREQLLDNYLKDLATFTVPFEGIEELIANLHKHNILWGIATNKPWAYTEPLMKHFRFASEPIAIICPEHVENKKPNPESLHLASSKVQCSTKEIIYVGDHLRDIQCGKRAKSPTIAVSYGYIQAHDNPEKWDADHIVDHANEIWPIIQTYL